MGFLAISNKVHELVVEDDSDPAKKNRKLSDIISLLVKVNSLSVKHIKIF